ncbi:MAG: hypothetical protein GDA56_10480 [Hormoscilla sp. GM7CHS1pb]|nr:hypothetical protein [Hormoscilla sp. GM7CHS1pb]
MERETVEQIVAWHQGQLDHRALGEYVLYCDCAARTLRDRQGCLEMDSASFNHFYLDILFSQAKFVFTIRGTGSSWESLPNPPIQNRTCNFHYTRLLGNRLLS